jgi:flagellar M-ring protein FliF
MDGSLQRLLSALARLPAGSKLALLAGIAMVVAVASVGWMWGTTPEYRVLFSNVSDRDGGAIVASLAQMNVPYKYSEGGSAILVPSTQVHDARLKLASQGLPKGSLVGFELMETQKFGLTQFQEQVNYQRALEGELARSIQSLDAVQAARVHLAIPKQSVFLREQQKPTASVLVSLHPGRTLEHAQVIGIIHLVSSSVPEMSPGNVSVLDQLGRLLSVQQGGLNLDPAQLAYVQQVEAGVVKRIQDILEPLVGRANVRAQVTADIDFSQGEYTAETYKPNQNSGEAAVRNQQFSDAGGAASVQAQGVPGAASNQPGTQSGGASLPGSVSGRRDTAVSYEVDRSVRHVRQPVGQVKRLSAAVVVNHKKTVTSDGKTELTPLPEATITQINALVKEAMGYTQTRGDSLNVANAAFSDEPTEALPEIPLWQQPDNIAMAKDLGKSAALGLLLLYLLFGIIRPLFRQVASAMREMPVERAVHAESLPEGEVMHVNTHNSRLDSVRELARQDPKVVANIVRNWVTKE